MMSVSVDVAIPNENKKNFSITPFETIKIHLLETILKFQKFRFFLPQHSLEPEPARQEVRRATNWTRRFWQIWAKGDYI